jgi:predicted nucleic acid-binding Zn finger protein
MLKKEENKIEENGDKTIYYLATDQETTITDNEVKRYKTCRFNLFDTYKSVYFKIWCVCLSDNVTQWKQGTCTCPSFLKNYICKHIIGLSIRLKYCKPPPEVKTIPIDAKRKRGRPSKAKKALIRQ